MQKLSFFVVFLVFAFLAIAGCSENQISFTKIEDSLGNPKSLNTEEKALLESHIKNAKENNYDLITTKELKNKLDNNDEMQIIATIPRGIYALGFIKDTKNFEFNDTFSGIWEKDTKNSQDKFIEFLGDKKKQIIFYDNGENSANTAAIWAKKLGYENVAVLVGGFKAWRERDFEISFDMPECCQI